MACGLLACSLIPLLKSEFVLVEWTAAFQTPTLPYVVDGSVSVVRSVIF